jgi:Zn-dependent peptidase ImmA (M78 family)/DNA-binding XRE family transcriptional regulator
MITTTTSLGPRLRQARELSGYSQQEVAELLGVAREVVSYWENNRRVPALAQVRRLAEAFGVSLDYLIGEEPESTAVEEHSLLYRGLKTQSPQTRSGIHRWLTFLDDWAALLTDYGEPLPGRQAPPRKDWRAATAITDSRQAPKLASEVREEYRLGIKAIPDLLSFLDSQRVLVYRTALDQVGNGEGISGAFYNHPQLGYCILVNTNTTGGRQAFTLAHEFAHALFHYQERGLISRAGDTDRKERFADAFAAHFLIPSETLCKLVQRLPSQQITSPFEVIYLQQHFRVSYATTLNRLRSEGLLTPEQYEEYRGYSPSALARQLGYDGDEYYPSNQSPVVSLATYPNSVLHRVHLLVSEGDLSPAGASDLLHVPQEEILEDLLARPEVARPEEFKEFSELPEPGTPRSRTGGGKHC